MLDISHIIDCNLKKDYQILLVFDMSIFDRPQKVDWGRLGRSKSSWVDSSELNWAPSWMCTKKFFWSWFVQVDLNWL